MNREEARSTTSRALLRNQKEPPLLLNSMLASAAQLNAILDTITLHTTYAAVVYQVVACGHGRLCAFSVCMSPSAKTQQPMFSPRQTVPVTASLYLPTKTINEKVNHPPPYICSINSFDTITSTRIPISIQGTQFNPCGKLRRRKMMNVLDQCELIKSGALHTNIPGTLPSV